MGIEGMEKQSDEIYCPQCGKPIKKEAAICPNCGVQVKELKVEKTQQATAQSQNIKTVVYRRPLSIVLIVLLGVAFLITLFSLISSHLTLLAIIIYFPIFIIITFSLIFVNLRKNKKRTLGFLISMSALIIILIISSVGFSNIQSKKIIATVAEATTTTTTKATTTAKKNLSYGDMVEVGPFEFTLVKSEVAKVDNPFADIKEAVLLYVTITNTSDETKDIMFIYHPVFGPDENEVESTTVGFYFDDSIDIMAKIRSGKTLEGYYVCEYIGDGEYIMEVYSLLEDPQEIYFEVKK